MYSDAFCGVVRRFFVVGESKSPKSLTMFSRQLQLNDVHSLEWFNELCDCLCRSYFAIRLFIEVFISL